MTYRIFTASLGAICTLAFGQAAFAASQGKVSQTIDRAALFTQLDVDGNGVLTQEELAKAGQLRLVFQVLPVAYRLGRSRQLG